MLWNLLECFVLALDEYVLFILNVHVSSCLNKITHNTCWLSSSAEWSDTGYCWNCATAVLFLWSVLQSITNFAECFLFSLSVLWCCWLGDRKDIWPVNICSTNDEGSPGDSRSGHVHTCPNTIPTYPSKSVCMTYYRQFSFMETWSIECGATPEIYWAS